MSADEEDIAEEDEGDERGPPWARPPFWAKEPSKADLDRRRCIELARVRRRLMYVDVHDGLTPAAFTRFKAKRRELIARLRKLEADLGLKPSRLGRGGLEGERGAGWRSSSGHRDKA